MERHEIRKPAVSGQFYPADPVRLERSVEEYIRESGVDADPEAVAVVVAPHAGYIYSGPSAGYTFARVRRKRTKRVILVGTSHRYRIDGACLYGPGAFETPAGTFPVDSEFNRAIADDLVTINNQPHFGEHCLEVQLPFLKGAIGVVPIVAALLGGPPTLWHVGFGEKLADMADEEDLLVASTDLSHYLTQAEAEEIDKATTAAVVSGDIEDFCTGIASGKYSMCGAAGVATAMAFARRRGAAKRVLWDLRTSAPVSGDSERVVGYAAMTMENGA